MRDYRLSVFIFVKDRDACMSYTQDVSFSLGSTPRIELVCMYEPRHVLCYASWPYPDILQIEKGSSLFSGPEGCSGLNLVWIINNFAFLAYYTQLGSSLVMMMILSINQSIVTYFVLISTSSVSACTIGSDTSVIFPHLIGFCGITVFQWYPMTYPWGYHLPGQCYTFLLWCIPPVWASLLKLGRGIGGIVFPLWRCMMMRSMCSHWCGGLQRQDLFSWLGFILISIWCAFMWPCGVYWGDRIRRNMVGVCLWRGYLPIGLMVLGSSSPGLRAFLYSATPTCLLKADVTPLVGELPHFWYDLLSHWWEVGPNHAPPLSSFLFPKLRHWYYV